MARAQVFAPVDIEATIARQQRCQVHTTRLQPRPPGTVGAQPRPARAAQRQHGDRRAQQHLALRRSEAQCTRCLLTLAINMPTQPAVPHVKAHALPAQPVQPSAQQRCGLHVAREYPPRAANEGGHAQGLGPGAQGGGPEVLQPRPQRFGAPGVARDKGLERLGMREVQAAPAGKQELAPHRGHGVEEIHRAAGAGQHFGRHQTRRAAPHHHDTGRCCRFVGGG